MQQLAPAWASIFDQPERLLDQVEDSLHGLVEQLCDVMVNCSSSAQESQILSCAREASAAVTNRFAQERDAIIVKTCDSARDAWRKFGQ